MTIGEILFAILPSLCVSVIMLFFNRRQAKREREEKARASQDRTQLSLLLATAKLSYASAIAIRDHKTNGEMADGVKQYQEAMHEFKKYERELVVDKSYEE
mgnify:CR=1 FL=1